VYGRRIQGRELRFEPSGILMHGALVMQDKETDSFWPILQGKAAYGPLKGARLEQLPVAVRARWKDWVREHPDTLVLSVNGRQHFDKNPQQTFHLSEYGYKGLQAKDTRLKTKEPVFAFEIDGKRYAASAKSLEGGRFFTLAGRSVFLYRPPDAGLIDPTRAFTSPAGFVRNGSAWVSRKSGARFDPGRGAFVGGDPPAPLRGFDTFWYVWSLNHPDTELLGAGS